MLASVCISASPKSPMSEQGPQKKLKALHESLGHSLRDVVQDNDARDVIKRLSEKHHNLSSLLIDQDAVQRCLREAVEQAVAQTMVGQAFFFLGAFCSRLACVQEEAEAIAEERGVAAWLQEVHTLEELGRLREVGPEESAPASRGRREAKEARLAAVREEQQREDAEVARLQQQLQASRARRASLLAGKATIAEQLGQPGLTEEQLSLSEWADHFRNEYLPTSKRTATKKKR